MKIAFLRITLVPPLFFLYFSFIPASAQEKYHIHIPEITEVKIDGSDREWEIFPWIPLYADQFGNYPSRDDLSASFKTAWNKNGLAFYFELQDDEKRIDTIHPWNGDAIEIYLSPRRGSSDILQIDLVPGPEKDDKIFIRVFDHRKSTDLRNIQPVIKASKMQDGKQLFIEFQVGFEAIGIHPEKGEDLALQVYIHDNDRDGAPNQLIWYPVGYSYTSSFAMFPVKLSSDKATSPQVSSRLVIVDESSVKASVFGTLAGDHIELFKSNKVLADSVSMQQDRYEPVIFDLSANGLNTESDTVNVKINGESIALHELFFESRQYQDQTSPPFDREIRNFVMQDRQNFPSENAVLFIGSSSIRMWNSLKEDFASLEIIQRGFGGSTMEDVLLYKDKIVLPYRASVIVIYEGDNDIVKSQSAERIRENMRQFIEDVQQSRLNTRILILSPKPSPARMKFRSEYEKLNFSFRKLSEEYRNVEFVDVWEPMFDQHGDIRRDLFLPDGVHMNAGGYELWKEILREFLLQ